MHGMVETASIAKLENTRTRRENLIARGALREVSAHVKVWICQSMGLVGGQNLNSSELITTPLSMKSRARILAFIVVLVPGTTHVARTTQVYSARRATLATLQRDMNAQSAHQCG